MKNDRLFEIMGDVDDSFVNETETPAKKTNSRVWVSLGAMAACAALIVTAALTLPNFRPDGEIDEEPPTEPSNIVGNEENFVPDVVDPDGEVVPGGKFVTLRLQAALHGTDGPVAMTAEVWSIDWDYVYDGYTLDEIRQLCVEETSRAFKMEELLKEGEYLKCGETLCTTGAPDGTRYAREFYEERVAYYGELLDKYIVDGEFLRKNVEQDLLEPERFYEELYDRAVSAYRFDRVSTLCQRLTDLGIACSPSEDGPFVHLTMSPAEFEALDLTDISSTGQVPRDYCYKFTLAGEEDDLMDFTDGAALDELHDGPVTTDDNPAMDLGEADSGGKYVTARLREALRETEEPVAMTAGVRGFDWGFVYDGRTLDELQRLCEEVTDVLYKLEELLKDGEYLKYGEAMCTTGAPDGARYARDHYEYLTAYYGELLDKYIVDGEFLRENVERDLAEKEDVYESFSRALTAYHTERVSTLYRRLSDLEIAYAVSENGWTIRLTMTPAEFETLDLTDISGTAPDDSYSWGYVFYLAGAEKNPMDTGDMSP